MQVNRTPQCYSIIAYTSQQNITSRLLVPRTDTHCPMPIRVRVLNCNNKIPPKTIRLPTALLTRFSVQHLCFTTVKWFSATKEFVKYVSIGSVVSKTATNDNATGRLLTCCHIWQKFLNPARNTGTQTRRAYCHRLVFINQGQKLDTIVQPVCALLLPLCRNFWTTTRDLHP